MPYMHIMYFDLSHLYILPLLPPKYGTIPPNFMSFFIEINPLSLVGAYHTLMSVGPSILAWLTIPEQKLTLPPPPMTSQQPSIAPQLRGEGFACPSLFYARILTGFILGRTWHAS